MSERGELTSSAQRKNARAGANISVTGEHFKMGAKRPLVNIGLLFGLH